MGGQLLSTACQYRKALAIRRAIRRAERDENTTPIHTLVYSMLPYT